MYAVGTHLKRPTTYVFMEKKKMSTFFSWKTFLSGAMLENRKKNKKKKTTTTKQQIIIIYKKKDKKKD